MSPPPLGQQERKLVLAEPSSLRDREVPSFPRHETEPPGPKAHALRADEHAHLRISETVAPRGSQTSIRWRPGAKSVCNLTHSWTLDPHKAGGL